MFKHSARTLPLKDSAKALTVGLEFAVVALLRRRPATALVIDEVRHLVGNEEIVEARPVEFWGIRSL